MLLFSIIKIDFELRYDTVIYLAQIDYTLFFEECQALHEYIIHY